ncbi:MAG TPA: M48 family metallopeptidase [Lacunisphaera sp.]|nr:M48 family metallopeptidase [Lacunisphaera sp.]
MSLVARLALVAAAWSLFLGAGCYQVPVTGRTAINMVSDQEVVKQSLAAFTQVKKKYRVSRDPQQNAMVQRVGERLARVAFWDVPDADWEFVVFDAPQTINAFAMAGGKVGVFSGLFKIVHNDDQLASVLAHEIGHVAAKHVNERLSQQMALQGGGLLVGGLMAGSGTGALTSNAVLEAYGLSSNLTAIGFDRKKEAEADHIGLMYMARAGYDPNEAIAVLEHLEETIPTQASAASWFSNHPSTPDRIEQLRTLLPHALEAYRQSGHTPTPILLN